MKISRAKEIVAAASATRVTARSAGTARGVGTLRGAMSGVLYPTGSGGQAPAVLSSKCPRIDQARFAGVEPAQGESDGVSFAGGFGHENYLAELFQKAGYENIPPSPEARDFLDVAIQMSAASIHGPRYHVMKEQGLKVTVHGHAWQGTPDFLLSERDEAGQGSLHGLEAKSLQSNWTVAKSLRAGWPPRKHILQCANYMSILGVEDWLLCVGHYFYALVDGEKFEPQVSWYRIFGGQTDPTEFLSVEREDGTIFQLDFCRRDVLAYQKLLLDSEAAGKLAPRPKWRELFPGMKAYEECNYCPAQMLNECNRYDVGKLTRAEWLERMKTKGPK